MASVGSAVKTLSRKARCLKYKCCYFFRFQISVYNNTTDGCFLLFLIRYAYKESDTWIRTLVKDLTLESGTGLTILDAVDISGGYTSVKDKTNVSIISTDICIHLSLSIITLVLNLQSQAASALQFRNANPLALCTNFECLRVSSEGPHFYSEVTLFLFYPMFEICLCCKIAI